MDQRDDSPKRPAKSTADVAAMCSAFDACQDKAKLAKLIDRASEVDMAGELSEADYVLSGQGHRDGREAGGRMTITMLDALVKVDACNEARRWVESYRPRAVRARDYWTACERGDWLLWVACALAWTVETWCALRARARLSLVHVPAGEPRPLRAIETAERWARGKATIEEVRAAYDAASAAARYAAYYYAAAAYDAAAAASAAARYAVYYYAAAAYDALPPPAAPPPPPLPPPPPPSPSRRRRAASVC